MEYYTIAGLTITAVAGGLIILRLVKDEKLLRNKTSLKPT